jgi:hypothetical protein
LLSGLFEASDGSPISSKYLLAALGVCWLKDLVEKTPQSRIERAKKVDYAFTR